MARANGFPSKSPLTARVAPKERAPTSPRIIRAGQILKYRKAIKEPIQRPKKIDKVVSRIDADITRKAAKQIKRRPDAKPSRPSEMFTAFVNDTMVKAAKGM